MALEAIGLQAILDDKNFQAGLKRYTSGVGQMTKITDGAAKMLSGAFVVGVGAATAAISAFAAVSKIGLDATLGWAENMDQLGDLFGMSGEQASAWTFLMNKVGLSLDEGAQGLNYFTRGLDDLKNAQGKVTPFGASLQKLGVNAYTAGGKLKTFDQIMPEIMDRFQKLPAGVNASALAMDLFGARGGSKFLDFLRQGGAGLKDATQKVKELGLEMSTAEVDAVEQFGFSVNELNLGLLGIKNSIGREVLPIAKKFVDWINTSIIPRISKLVQDWMPKLYKGLDKLGEIIGDLLGGKWYAKWELQSFFEKIFGYQATRQIFNIIDALGRLRQWIETGVLPVVRRLWEAFQQRGAGGLFDQLVQEIQRAAPGIQAQLAAWGGQFWNWLTGPGGALSQAGSKLAAFAAGVGNAVRDNWPLIQAEFATWASEFWSWFTAPEGPLARTGVQLEKLMYAMKIWITNPANMQPVWDALGGWASQFWGWLTDSKSGLLVTVADNMAKLAAAIRAWTEDPATIKQFQDFGRQLAQDIIDGMGRLFDDKGTGDNLILRLISTLWNALRDLNQSFLNMGQSTAQGIVSGITNQFYSQDTLQSLYNAIWNALQGAVNLVIPNIYTLAQQIMNAWNWFWQNNPMQVPAPSVSGGAAGWAGQAYANGGPVMHTGLALVHRGEYVIPARTMQNINNSRSIGAVNVSINGSTGMGKRAIRQAIYEGISEVLNRA